MNKGQVEYAVRQAYNKADEWLEETGVIELHTGYYYELQGVIEDAVHIGIQMALNNKVNYNEDGEVIKEDIK
jgi:hypothetical protein